MTATNVQQLMERKQISAKEEHRRALALREILKKMPTEDFTDDEKRTWVLSVVNPANNRVVKAAKAVEFWQDEEQVSSWLEVRQFIAKTNQKS